MTRQKRESDGAGNNPSVQRHFAERPRQRYRRCIQSELNTVFDLDDHIGGETTLEPDNEPVTISVEDANDDATDADASEATGDDGDESEDGNDDADV